MAGPGSSQAKFAPCLSLRRWGQIGLPHPGAPLLRPKGARNDHELKRRYCACPLLRVSATALGMSCMSHEGITFASEETTAIRTNNAGSEKFPTSQHFLPNHEKKELLESTVSSSSSSS